ncbi:MAG: ABC transporter ATP-binding protein, partial [Desulfuromonadales bacterium]
MMTGCNFLLLDEPSMGLAPRLKYDLFRTLKKLNEEGMTILLVEQNAHLALHLAHRGYVLDTGKLAAAGSSKELLGNPDVKKAYLGG